MKQPETMAFSALLASSVHDMKNSVGLVMHLVEQLRAGQPSGDEQFGQLSFEASRLNNYLIQLMTLYKLEQDQYRSQHSEQYLDEFIEDLLMMSRPALDSRGISTEIDVDPELCWEFDVSLVNGTLGSVLTNLLRYADRRIRISARSWRPDCSDSGSDDGAHRYLRLQIEDDGPGFPESMLGRLDRIPMGVDFVSGSTGFGLYFARQVAQLHRRDQYQGFVELSNGGPLGGACFQLCLP